MPHGTGGLRGFARDTSELKHTIKPGTIPRIVGFGASYAWTLGSYLALIVVGAAVGTINPLIYREVINKGVLANDPSLVVLLALAAAGIAVVDAALTFVQRWISTRIGQDMLLDMRSRVFSHIQTMSLAFFTRTRTGSLVSRLNTDVSGVSNAFTDILSGVVSNLATTILVLTAMFFLSWQLTLAALVLIPVFVIPARYVGKKLQALTRTRYDLSSEMNNMMVERFNVSGAMLTKVFGTPAADSKQFRAHAKNLRDIAIQTSTYSRIFFISLGLVASLAVAVAYGWGGVLVIHGALDIGTLVAITAYLLRLYGPLTALSNVQVDVMTAIVSFERVFEVLDLKPTIEEMPNAMPIPAGPARLEFRSVHFRYPTASEVSLASLESVAALSTRKEKQVLNDISFVAEPGTMTALVGQSGAGKTTITQLIPRFYDPMEGSVLINGLDVRGATFESLRNTIGTVMQEAHMFHDTLRANLLFAKPDATDADIHAALEQAQILPLVQSLPQGLDTVLGERGYRLSGGEKQRLAIARVLLKAPSIVILDEATAHLDSESEAAIQKAFEVALAGRTSVVIAHRLSTIRNADQILVMQNGRIDERGTHDNLVTQNGLYAELYRTQFAEN